MVSRSKLSRGIEPEDGGDDAASLLGRGQEASVVARLPGIFHHAEVLYQEGGEREEHGHVECTAKHAKTNDEDRPTRKRVGVGRAGHARCRADLQRRVSVGR
eukprot:SAG31_NODE_1260_length_9073_cov_2.761088_6_plen_102_part_00